MRRRFNPKDSKKEIFNGLSIYREYNPADLSSVFEKVKSHTNNVKKRMRDGVNGEKRSALMQLELSEVVHNLPYLMGSIVTKELIDEVFDSVPTIRRPLKLTTSGVRPLRNQKCDTQMIAIGFDDETKDTLNEERKQITEILGRYSIEDSLFWMPRKTPHISIVEIPLEIDKSTFVNVARAVSEAPEEIVIGRAKFYTPNPQQ